MKKTSVYFLLLSVFATTDANAQTPCASGAFANAMATTANTISESDPEHVIQSWIYDAFQAPATIRRVLACAEVANVPDSESIIFSPVEYVFPAGRRIVINYETQPKVLKQRLLINGKRSLPDTDPNPRIGAPNDAATWTNTEPAWYGILVVQSDSLNEFVGPQKNNTLSLKYLEQNIGKFYPQGAKCTSKSALARDSYVINTATKRTVSIEDDTNDYYVAGDANLQWITWGEVALDVAITIVTVGAGTVVLGITKGARSARAAKGLVTSIRTLEKSADVRRYMDVTRRSTTAARELENIDRVRDAAAYTAKSDEIRNLNNTARSMENIDDVKKYRDATAAFTRIMEWRHAMKAWKIPQRGNVVARGWRSARAGMQSLRAINSGNNVIGGGARIARAGMQSGKVRDWLFQNTLKNVGKLAKLERTGGLLYGGLKLVGGMYDWSETSTGEFTSDIDFKPLGLLSADDLAGQENVVNHGMWLMWAGDSVSPMDDDAAYLQAMDFASKFHQDIEETQEDIGNHCNIDIFVVRPIIKNPGDDDAALYYLIMNDEPWKI